jgi:hypothetical protein
MREKQIPLDSVPSPAQNTFLFFLLLSFSFSAPCKHACAGRHVAQNTRACCGTGALRFLLPLPEEVLVPVVVEVKMDCAATEALRWIRSRFGTGRS